MDGLTSQELLYRYIAGQSMANPIATILSAAMMLKFSFGLTEESAAIENAVTKILDAGYRTPDIYTEGTTKVGTKEMGRLIRGMIHLPEE